ncbi:MAG: hypothetical protein BGO31_03690 [Bacteroidetes bacterium 43-16]|nr:MAG: hypothetical protein BGO31_03690 [Bacteroidetes bacterium 43-16]
MRKTIIVIGLLGVASLTACKGGGSGNISQKWEVVYDNSGRDSAFNAQLQSVDTMTAFPPDFIEMKAELAKMKPDSIATLPPEVVEMLKIEDLPTLKAKIKENLMDGKKQQDSLEAKRSVIYDFQKNGVLKMYASDMPDQMVDTSTKYTADMKAKKLFLFANQAIVKGEMANDTVTFDILHISGDSLSLKVDPKSKGAAGPNIKPMAFKLYKEEKKK